MDRLLRGPRAIRCLRPDVLRWSGSAGDRQPGEPTDRSPQLHVGTVLLFVALAIGMVEW